MMLALRLFWREWRSGELRILIAALIIAVAALTTIGTYTSRISRALETQAAELLGGDLQLSSSIPLSSEWKSHAESLGLKNTTLTLISSMLLAGEQLQLANIKAVSAHYPLRGHVRTLLSANSVEEQIEKDIPEPGTIWIEARLLTLLNISLNKPVKIGRAEFIVRKIISYEPDTQPYNLNIAPRVIMNARDLPATEIIQPGSRVEYRWLLMGSPAAIQDFSAWITPKLSPDQKLRNATEGLSELKSTLQKANGYLHLSAIACVILAGIAIATAARRYSQRHYDITALLRCFGVTQRKILQLYLGYLFCLGILASLIGILIGYFAQFGLAAIFTTWMSLSLPSPAFSSFILSLIIGVVILFGFALPPILALKNISPIRVLRRDMLIFPGYSVLSYFLAATVIIGLLLWYTENLKLTFLFLGSILLVGALLYLTALGTIKISTYFRKNFPGQNSAFRYGLANLARRSNSSAIQLVAFGLVIMTILLLTVTRNNLLETWQQQLPSNAPNYFAINIQPQEIKTVQQLLEKRNIKTNGIYPMVRGRLTELNNKPILDAVPASARTNNALHRELNLTWTDILPLDNRIVKGHWWERGDKNKPIISIEAKLAKDLGITLNDQLTFQIGDKKIQATVQSIRTLEWDNFHPNFFIIFPPGTLEKMPATYITSFYVPVAKKQSLTELIRQFPNVTLIDIAMILTQARNLTQKMALAIELILGFSLAAGLAVLYAALQTSRDERLLEGAILRTLGASSHFLKMSLITEFMTLGFLAGLLGATGASLIGFVLATQVFDMVYQWSAWPWIIGIISGTLLIGIFGVYGTRDVIKQSPLVVLQEI